MFKKYILKNYWYHNDKHPWVLIPYSKPSFKRDSIHILNSANNYTIPNIYSEYLYIRDNSHSIANLFIIIIIMD
jgi:hypothetical protein